MKSLFRFGNIEEKLCYVMLCYVSKVPAAFHNLGHWQSFNKKRGYG